VVAERSRRYRKCDRDDAHDDESQEFFKGGAGLSPKTEEDAIGWEPKYAKRDSDPKREAPL
jgi:hypothetical protein